MLHDGSPEVLAAFAAFGEKTSGNATVGETGGDENERFWKGKRTTITSCFADSGSAARFFTQCPLSEDELRFHYSGKANKTDRADSKHPTIKPLSLIEWLCRLICPPGGHVLDPFAGSGITGEACMKLGFNCTLIERDDQHAADIRHRIKRWSGLDAPLFAQDAAQ